jgi:hypothetical protein
MSYCGRAVNNPPTKRGTTAEGRRTCSQSRIAGRRELSSPWRFRYPRWLTPAARGVLSAPVSLPRQEEKGLLQAPIVHPFSPRPSRVLCHASLAVQSSVWGRLDGPCLESRGEDTASCLEWSILYPHGPAGACHPCFPVSRTSQRSQTPMAWSGPPVEHRSRRELGLRY